MRLKKFNEMNDSMDRYNSERMGDIGEDHPDFEDKFYGEGYVNPELLPYENEIVSIKNRLREVNNELENFGPLDENIEDAIEALSVVIDKINKAK